MLAVMPPALVVVLTAVLARRKLSPENGKVRGCSLSEAFVFASGFVVGWALAGTWIMSGLSALDRWPLAAWWAVGLFFAIWAGFTGRVFSHFQACGVAVCFRGSLVGLGLRLFVASLLACAFVMGAAYAPNNADSLVYHLPRQVVWVSLGSVFVDPMPTGHMGAMPPLAEILQLQLLLLGESERWAFLIQFWSLCVSLTLIGLIVRDCGGTSTAGWYACAFFMTVPAVFL
jgi:hypothetical protein